MTQKNFKKTIAFVAQKINRKKIKWALIGSSNLALQGIFVKPKDIGILVDFLDKSKVEKIFSGQKIIKNWILPNKQGEEAIYLIDGIEVLFCFEYEHGFYYKFLKQNKFKTVLLGKEKIHCNRLEDEIEAYKFLGKNERAEEIKDFVENKIEEELFEKILAFAQQAYHTQNITGQAHRPGSPMPYLAHPMHAASLIANDRRLTLKERSLGFQTLILHDVLEDTAAKLPKWLSAEVKELVKEMTYKDWEEKKKVIRKKSKFVKLLLLADGLVNMYEETVGEHKRKEYKEQVQYLMQEAEKNYPKSRMVEIGKTIIEKTNW